MAKRDTSDDTALAMPVRMALPVCLPKIPYESDVALSVPAALQGIQRGSKGLLHFERRYNTGW